MNIIIPNQKLVKNRTALNIFAARSVTRLFVILQLITILIAILIAIL